MLRLLLVTVVVPLVTAKNSLETLTFANPFELHCTFADEDENRRRSPTCLYDVDTGNDFMPDHEDGREISMVGLRSVWATRDVEDPEQTWCFFDEPNVKTTGFMRTEYTDTSPVDPNLEIVHGDPSEGRFFDPSTAVLVFGHEVAENPSLNCGDVVGISVKGSNRRPLYAVIAAATRVAEDNEQENIGDNDIHLYVSPRFLLTVCCEDLECFDEYEYDPTANEFAECDPDLEFEYTFITEETASAKVPQGLVMGLLSSDDLATSCDGLLGGREEDTRPALAVQVPTTWGDYGYPAPGGGDSAGLACGQTYRVYIEGDESKHVDVTVQEYQDTSASEKADGTFHLLIRKEECEELCGEGNCNGGPMGSPPPTCHLKFKEPTPEVTTTTTTMPTATTSSTSTTDEDGEVSSTRSVAEEWNSVSLKPWMDIAARCEFSCGMVQEPQDCGTEAKPCLAAQKGQTCGDILEVKNEDGQGRLFVQIADTTVSDLLISAVVWPQVCQNACQNGSGIKCKEACEGDEVPLGDYCACAECNGGVQESEEGCVCEVCAGHCKQVPGSTRADERAGFYRYVGNLELPGASVGQQAIPLCALAAASMV